MFVRKVIKIFCVGVLCLIFGLNTVSYADFPVQPLAQKRTQTYLGFTPWPYDLTEAAVLETYEFLKQNGNITSHHLDNGVPWVEAYEQRDLPSHLKDNWQKRIEMTPKGHKIFLSVTPLDFDRKALAKYWSDAGEGQKLPKEWEHKNFDHPNIKKAYLNYTREAIKAFRPDFLAIGIESNVLISHAPQKWDAYLALHAYVYQALKMEYPDLPIFATIQYEHYRGIEDVSKKNAYLQEEKVKQLMHYSDYVGLSTYRYGMIHPNPPKKDYFTPALSFKKPIAIAETGAMSETTLVMGMPLISNEKTQYEFMKMILENAKTYHFPFVINWVSRDFDPMLKKLPKEVRGIAKAWVHTGLVTDRKKKKKAYYLWQDYLAR